LLFLVDFRSFAEKSSLHLFCYVAIQCVSFLSIFVLLVLHMSGNRIFFQISTFFIPTFLPAPIGSTEVFLA